jgi:hypothetical protein
MTRTRWALTLILLGVLALPVGVAFGAKGGNGGGKPGGGGDDPPNTTPLDILYTVAEGSGYGTLYAVQDDGTGATKLADTRGGATWSPDGTQVAYYGYVNGFGIYILDMESGNSTKLISIDNLTAGFVDWCPVPESDGTHRLAFTMHAASGSVDVFVARFDDTGLLGLENVTNTSVGTESFVTWSPNGEQLAVGYHQRIRVIDLENRDSNGSPTAHDVYESIRFFPYSVVWSKTGDEIAFKAYDADYAQNGGTGLTDIFVFEVSDASGSWTGTTPVNVTNSPNDEENSLTWSPDDSKLLIHNSYWAKIGKGTSKGSWQLLELGTGTRTTIDGKGGQPKWRRATP